jgi:hypothetical protein
MSDQTPKAEPYTITVEPTQQAMSPRQENLVSEIQEWFSSNFDSKFRKGQLEHGGDLDEKRTDEFMGEEILDFVSYYFVLFKHRKQIKALLEYYLTECQEMGTSPDPNVVKAYNILTTGNERGEILSD